MRADVSGDVGPRAAGHQAPRQQREGEHADYGTGLARERQAVRARWAQSSAIATDFMWR